MEKPTVEQIKKHFENAKEVRCLLNNKVYKLNTINDYSVQGSLWGYTFDNEGILLYDPLQGYAEIISPHETKEVDVKALKKHLGDIYDTTPSQVTPKNINEINVIFDEVKVVDKEALFNEVVSDTLEQIKETLLIKGKEYRRNNNPFHNFEEGARIKGITREKVLDGMLLKHEISINDMTNDLDNNILPSEEIVNEKFNDNIIYLILKKASILDRIKNNLKQ